MVFGRLWRYLNLDVLVGQCYAPGCSRFNPIERSWAYLTQCLVSVELEVEIEENNYETPDTNEKWDIVLDKAVLDCGRFWHGKTLDSFPITVYPFLSSDTYLVLSYAHAILRKNDNGISFSTRFEGFPE